MRRSTQYRATVTTLNDPLVGILKHLTKVLNLRQKTLELDGKGKVKDYFGDTYVTRYRMIPRGRLGKHNVHAPLYAVGGPLYRYAAQTIRPEHSTRFDLYVSAYSQKVKS
ncbi:hypothetical protein UFOVP132_21 [uncultured Caudovirales phage]|uniref:Uncharacterized protein n=1 Tax=uncultured Caudovirales phage TaxID=2100421 RepID=A0A6J5L8P2_9CAUD|nr:hypothetical protein UFOVP132_21 [uncultured Caudovirales phage]